VIASNLDGVPSHAVGSGGMADTRDPEASDNEDPRKSISAAPSFDEYLKERDGRASATIAGAPAATAAPVSGRQVRSSWCSVALLLYFCLSNSELCSVSCQTPTRGVLSL